MLKKKNLHVSVNETKIILKANVAVKILIQYLANRKFFNTA
jgi:hypothetical protein